MQRTGPPGAARGSEHLLIACVERVAQLGEQCFAVGIVPENLAERYGVGGITGKVCLVDVEAYADDGAGDVDAFDVVLDEDAAQLVVAVVDVVGPLDADVVGVSAQHLAEYYGDEFAEDKLLRCCDVGGAEGEAEEEVLAALGLPRVAMLATSGSLVVGGDERDAVWVGQQPGIGVRGVGLGKVYAVYALGAHSGALVCDRIVAWRKNNAFFVLYFAYTS